MELIAKEMFLKQADQALADIYDALRQAPARRWAELPAERTAVLVLDMINGFVKEGALASPRVEAIVDDVVQICRRAGKLGVPVVAFADEHTEASPEFASFPQHCLRETAESQIIAELSALGGYARIGKNSTNGFLEPAFERWLETHQAIDHFIVIGDCTDICVMQMAQSLKAWFNRQNRFSRLLVPMNAVETYTLGAHDGELLNVLALYMMAASGMEIVRKIED